MRLWHSNPTRCNLLNENKKQCSGLFALARHKVVSVASNIILEGGVCCWNLNFIQDFHDWKLELVDKFFVFCFTFFILTFKLPTERFCSLKLQMSAIG